MLRPSINVCLLILVVIGCGTSDRSQSTSPPQPEAGATESADQSSVGIARSPEEYLDDHLILLNPSHAKWTDAVSRLEKSGNAFTIVLLNEMGSKDLSNAQEIALDGLRSKIEAGSAAAGESVQTLLERAAYADLMCNPLETRLKKWTLTFVGKRLDEPGVRTELEGLRSQYTPRVQGTTLFSSMQERVPMYAKALLKEEKAAQ